jgi:hypothetical protein
VKNPCAEIYFNDFACFYERRITFSGGRTWQEEIYNSQLWGVEPRVNYADCLIESVRENKEKRLKWLTNKKYAFNEYKVKQEEKYLDKYLELTEF